MKFVQVTLIIILFEAASTLKNANKHLNGEIKSLIAGGANEETLPAQFTVRIVSSKNDDERGNLLTGVAVSPRRILTVAQAIVG